MPEPGEVLPLRDRLQIYFDRLRALPPAANAAEAFAQVSRTLEEVEDDHSGVIKNPNPGLESDGRMYPPRADMTWNLENGGMHAVTRGNLIDITPGGTIAMRRRDNGAEVLRKPGVGDNGPQLDQDLQKVRQLGETAYPKGLRAAAEGAQATTSAAKVTPKVERGGSEASR
ncbi:hypothetical protein [Kribbella sp. NPDC055071]